MILYSGSKNPCAPEHQWCCTVLTVGMSHAWNTLGETRDLSQAIPTITLCKFSASLAILSFTNTNSSSDMWTVTFLSPCTLDTHHRTQRIIFQGPQTVIDFLPVSEACDAIDSQIRVSAMLLLLMVGKWDYGLLVTFKSMTSYMVTVGQLADTQTVR